MLLFGVVFYCRLDVSLVFHEEASLALEDIPFLQADVMVHIPSY